MFEIRVTFENIASSYIPTGAMLPKKEFAYIEKSKFFDRFISAMSYIFSVEKRNDVVKVVFVNHKTGEEKEYLV